LKRLAMLSVSDLQLEPGPPPGNGVPRFAPETTVRDGLAALLASPAEAGVVTGGGGEYLGTVTLEAVARAARVEGPSGVARADGAEEPLETRP
jgi:hypothetical protein